MQGPTKKKKKKRRAGGKRPNWDACTASNVCCLLAWLHMTKYGRKKALFPVSNTHKKRKTQGFHMLCRQIEPSYSNTLTTEREWRELLSALHRANDSAMWRLSSIKQIYSQKQQNIPNALPVPNHIQTLFYTILNFLRKKNKINNGTQEKSFSLPAFFVQDWVV